MILKKYIKAGTVVTNRAAVKAESILKIKLSFETFVVDIEPLQIQAFSSSLYGNMVCYIIIEIINSIYILSHIFYYIFIKTG